jgi:aspartate aminotransferase-like enzyme
MYSSGIKISHEALGRPSKLCGRNPEQYSKTVSAIYVPDGFNRDTLVELAYKMYGVCYGLGSGKVAGECSAPAMLA